MTNMLEKKFTNKELGIELTSYIDKQQNVWFRGKDVATILGYRDTDKAIRSHVEEEDKYKGAVETAGGQERKSYPVKTAGYSEKSFPAKTAGYSEKSFPVVSTGYSKRGRPPIFINESGFYSLLLTSKLETAKKFKHWVTSQVLPSIRKYGQYKLFDSPWNKMIMIGNERDLHYKVVQLIRNYYPDSILVAGLGENQDTEEKRLDSYKKGYLRGTPDLMILNYHKDYRGLCIEFKSPTNNYEVSESQIKMKEKYRSNDYAFILSNDYDKISKLIHKYMAGVRIPCKYCPKAFRSKTTLNNHYKVIHRIEKNI